MMTPEQARQLKSGDIVHVRMEFNGRVYLDGDGVVQYLYDSIGNYVQCSSVMLSNYFSGCYECRNITLVKSSNTSSEAETKLDFIKQKLIELSNLIGG